jgi:hypothetical protein
MNFFDSFPLILTGVSMDFDLFPLIISFDLWRYFLYHNGAFYVKKNGVFVHEIRSRDFKIKIYYLEKIEIGILFK